MANTQCCLIFGWILQIVLLGGWIITNIFAVIISQWIQAESRMILVVDILIIVGLLLFLLERTIFIRKQYFITQASNHFEFYDGYLALLRFVGWFIFYFMSLFSLALPSEDENGNKYSQFSVLRLIAYSSWIYGCGLLIWFFAGVLSDEDSEHSPWFCCRIFYKCHGTFCIDINRREYPPEQDLQTAEPSAPYSELV